MTRLLVSVRSVAEAEAALAGGADLIDVKEPARGSLGRAPEATLTAVVRAVAGRRPVSAALGELLDGSRDDLPSALPDLAFVKWGLADCGGPAPGRWQDHLTEAARAVAAGAASCGVVAVAYADWRRAGAPAPAEVCSFACGHRLGAFLLDTWGKDGSTLLDWVDEAEVGRLCRSCRAAGVPVALAGSLGLDAVLRLREVRPDWFAVRGAACRGGERGAVLDEDRVRLLAATLHPPGPLTRARSAG